MLVLFSFRFIVVIVGSFSEGCTDDPETVLLRIMRIIRSQPPYAMGSNQTPVSVQDHGNLTPAGFSIHSVEKYHYPRCNGHRLPVATRVTVV